MAPIEGVVERYNQSAKLLGSYIVKYASRRPKMIGDGAEDLDLMTL
jgi:hypothetical protein